MICAQLKGKVSAVEILDVSGTEGALLRYLSLPQVPPAFASGSSAATALGELDFTHPFRFV